MKIKNYLSPQAQEVVIKTEGVLLSSPFSSGSSSGQNLSYDGSEETFDSFFGS